MPLREFCHVVGDATTDGSRHTDVDVVIRRREVGGAGTQGLILAAIDNPSAPRGAAHHVLSSSLAIRQPLRFEEARYWLGIKGLAPQWSGATGAPTEVHDIGDQVAQSVDLSQRRLGSRIAGDVRANRRIAVLI